jgi:DnaJ-class molecular chaperone
LNELDLFAECDHCHGTGSHFETPDYKWTGLATDHNGHCSKCGGKGLLFSEEGDRIRALVQALKAYPKSRSSF